MMGKPYIFIWLSFFINMVIKWKHHRFFSQVICTTKNTTESYSKYITDLFLSIFNIPYI